MHIARTRTAVGVAISAIALGTLPAWTAHAEPTAPGRDTARHAPHHPRPASDGVRQIPLQGAVNARDLGGYRTYDGDRVRYGRVFRADALAKLTDADVGTLAKLGLKKVVDFRVPAEVKYDGADRLPAGLSATSRAVNDNGLFTMLMTVIGSKDPVKQEEMLGNGKADAFMRDVYRTFVTDGTNRAQFAATLRDIARGGDAAPLLYHCTSGKDRTGWTSYLLLRAIGVPERTAVGDYLASNTYRAAYDAKVRESLKQSGMMQNPDLLIPLQEVRTGYLEASLDEVKKQYGSLDGYLRKGLGLDARTILALRERMVD
ncbi:tyrosine-protein phosphatase [Streptomyces sp. NBC_01381]|uniref:tyrosine-protein phosphatase n=1 Tax=Streptomyces sp. NBC_01381 TaxID=2903845 RepID=UPI00224D8C89|nr:tyrosine-protein phosphatase [Streptomyces sp. NBC_01381]MCX4667897.1 tyrosine-protein phosphatase [Streptomyces sp. NBC_01381]